MKRITILVTFIFIILVGSFIVLSDKVLQSVVNPYAIRVFEGLLIFEASLMGIAEFGKKFTNRVEQKDEENTKKDDADQIE